MDAFLQKGVVFDHCFAQGNRTELSFGSIFTSLYPYTHGVRRVRSRANPLVEEIDTLAENMRDAGLHTEGLLTNPFLKRECGLTQGFDRVEEFHYGYLELRPLRALMKLGLFSTPDLIPQTEVPRGSVVADRTIERLRRQQGRPFFLFVHFMDVHHPYEPPAPYESMFTSPEASQVQARQLWKRNWSVFKMLPSEQPLLSTGDLLRIVDLYDGAIRYVDDQIRRILDELDRQGLAGNTLVIITSDHGDEFLDHGDIFHKSPFLYDELIHVPLLVRYPGDSGGRRESAIVRHIDIMPTLLALFGLPVDGAAQGRSLLPLLGGTGVWKPVPAFSQSYEFISVRTPERKLMYDLAHDKGYCFDLTGDPGERTNVYGDEAACGTLESDLIGFLKRTVAHPADANPHEIDPRTRRILGSLGYLGL